MKLPEFTGSKWLVSIFGLGMAFWVYNLFGKPFTWMDLIWPVVLIGVTLAVYLTRPR
jgi:hypothetical protein